MKKSRLLIALLTFMFTLSSTSVFAVQNDTKNTVSDNVITSEIIDCKDIPDNITPMIFSSKESADQYF